jgi:hypothetical protein
VEYSKEIHEGEWLVALLADFDREDVAPNPGNRYRNSITVKGRELGLIPMTFEARSISCSRLSRLFNFRQMAGRRRGPECPRRLHALAGVGLFRNSTSGFGVSFSLLGSYCVTNRVHAIDALGNGMRLMASGTELLLDDCSPQTTSCGSSSS